MIGKFMKTGCIKFMYLENFPTILIVLVFLDMRKKENGPDGNLTPIAAFSFDRPLLFFSRKEKGWIEPTTSGSPRQFKRA